MVLGFCWLEGVVESGMVEGVMSGVNDGVNGLIASGA
jgi:hypothetical protein